MRKFVYPVAILTALALGACSPKAKNETSEAANTMAADANATMAKAAGDVDAAFGAAENGIDAAGNKVDKATKDAKGAAGATLKDMGNEIQD